jgi:hypothetical protein
MVRCMQPHPSCPTFAKQCACAISRNPPGVTNGSIPTCCALLGLSLLVEQTWRQGLACTLLCAEHLRPCLVVCCRTEQNTDSVGHMARLCAEAECWHGPQLVAEKNARPACCSQVCDHAARRLRSSQPVLLCAARVSCVSRSCESAAPNTCSTVRQLWNCALSWLLACTARLQVQLPS